jgi:hypothetical protein
MNMLAYIAEIQRQFLAVYKFPPNAQGLPDGVQDGYYPMTIGGKLDHVQVVDGYIRCCRFGDENKPKEFPCTTP